MYESEAWCLEGKRQEFYEDREIHSKSDVWNTAQRLKKANDLPNPRPL